MAQRGRTPGCGWTTRELWSQLIASRSQEYEEGLMRVGVKPTKRQALKDGYMDGMRAALRHLEGMGVLIVFEPDEVVVLEGEETKVGWTCPDCGRVYRERTTCRASEDCPSFGVS